MAYPATFDVQPPKEFDKSQVVLRIVLIIVISWLLDAIAGFAYIALPVIAAVRISQKGPKQYLADAEAGPTKWLRYIMAIYSYMALTTDRMPTQEPEKIVQFDVQPTGSPTIGSALLRIILGIPHAIVLGLLGLILAIVWLIAAVSILFSGTYPEWASSFIRGYLRWTARFMAYMASLVDEYPPFSFQNGEPTAAPPAQPAASEPPTKPSAAGATSSGQGDTPPTEPSA